MADESVSLPSLAVLLVLGGLAIRYLFFSTPSAAAQPNPRDSASALRTREAAVEQLQQMFPQVDRRTLLWDLQRAGGNMAVTTERALAGRLETPPVSFQPPPPPASRTGTPAGASRRGGSTPVPAQNKPATPDLITRYNLQDKVASKDEPEVAQETPAKKGQAWSASKEERQSLLQKRRDAMILEARRKLEAKLKAEKEGGS